MTGQLWSLVLAGGFGKRLSSLTEAMTGEAVPKQYCRFGSSRTLLQETLDRSKLVVPEDRTVVVVDETQAERARAQLGDRDGLVLVGQPGDRDTAPGILLPLVHILERDPDAVVIVMPSDHGVADEHVLARSLRRGALGLEENPNALVLFGVEATEPTTDLGWILPGEEIGGTVPLRRIQRFVEKPGLQHARHLLRQGGRWNTFLMAARGRALLRVFRDHLPEHFRVFSEYARKSPTGRDQWLRSAYRWLSRANFSRDVVAILSNVLLYEIPATIGWSDLGTVQSLIPWLESRGRLHSVLNHLGFEPTCEAAFAGFLRESGSDVLVEEAKPAGRMALHRKNCDLSGWVE